QTKQVPPQRRHEPDPGGKGWQPTLGAELNQVVMQMTVVTTLDPLPGRHIEGVIPLDIVRPNAKPGMRAHHSHSNPPHLKPDREGYVGSWVQRHIYSFAQQIR